MTDRSLFARRFGSLRSLPARLRWQLRRPLYRAHYALVGLNYEHGLLATEKSARGRRWRSYELYNRHGRDALLSALLSRLSPGEVVVDVGANTGTYALAAAATGPDVRVVAFEPTPTVAAQCRQNVACNGWEDRIDVREVALCDADERRTFYRSTYEELSSLEREHAGAWEASVREEFAVPGRRLDTLVECGDVPPPDHVKIDVEGVGAAVLAGMERVLAAHRPVVYFEPHSSGAGGGAGDDRSSDEARSRLESAGYAVSDLGDGWVCTPRGE